MTKCQKDPTCGMFLKRGLFKGIKNDIPMCQTRKYKSTNTCVKRAKTKNANTQINKYIIWGSARVLKKHGILTEKLHFPKIKDAPNSLKSKIN